MGIAYILLIAAANNLDNIGVILSYSMKGIKIPLSVIGWISMISLFLTLTADFAGRDLNGYISNQAAGVINLLLLAGTGLWSIFGQRPKRKSKKSPENLNIMNIVQNPEAADFDNSKTIDILEAVFLGTALSLNNAIGGLSAGIMGINAFAFALISTAFSFLTLYAGRLVHKKLYKAGRERIMGCITGIILIVLGVLQLFII
jgi:putative sporulation protein YtaF